MALESDLQGRWYLILSKLACYIASLSEIAYPTFKIHTTS